MAEVKNNNSKPGYIGNIPNAGTMVVQAPHQKSQPSKNNVIRGKDLRSGQK